jgi:hypothetical protein
VIAFIWRSNKPLYAIKGDDSLSNDQRLTLEMQKPVMQKFFATAELSFIHQVALG